MTLRILGIDIIFGCCLDEIELVPLEKPRPVRVTTRSYNFKTTLSQWKDKVLAKILPVLEEKADILKCKKISTSFDVCNFSYTITQLKEITEGIPPIPGIETITDLEETIYTIYMNRHKRLRIIPYHVTDAVDFLIEYGIHRLKKTPRPGIKIERYCFGEWCFDTISHAKEFTKKYPEIASIISELNIDTEIR